MFFSGAFWGAQAFMCIFVYLSFPTLSFSYPFLVVLLAYYSFLADDIYFEGEVAFFQDINS